MGSWNIVHPPNEVHSYIADLLAGAIQREWHKVPQEQLGEHCLKDVKSGRNYVIPKPLTYHEEEYECNISYPLLLDAVFNTETPQHGEMIESPANSWTHSDEGRGKFGLISEFSEGGATQINVTFRLDVKEIERFSETLYIEEEVSVRIEYMQTCTNAGKVKVYLCDSRIADLDALWSHHFTEIVSFDQFIKIKCIGDSHPSLVIVHSFVSESDKVRATARTHAQKFKLGAVKVCHADPIVASSAGKHERQRRQLRAVHENSRRSSGLRTSSSRKKIRS